MKREAEFMPRGFYTGQGYVGFLPGGGRMVFPTAEEYLDYIDEMCGEAA